MQLTPEQQEQIRQAKARGERRINLELTPAQKRQYQEEIALEMVGKEANIALGLRLKAAAEQPGFFGDIRRAIHYSRQSLHELAATSGVEERVLSDFLTGEGELPAAALDRLLDRLGLRLMQEIPK